MLYFATITKTKKNQTIKQRKNTMKMTVYKAKKSHEQYLQDLRDGKPVKATDLMSSMGIKTIVIK